MSSTQTCPVCPVPPACPTFTSPSPDQFNHFAKLVQDAFTLLSAQLSSMAKSLARPSTNITGGRAFGIEAGKASAEQIAKILTDIKKVTEIAEKTVPIFVEQLYDGLIRKASEIGLATALIGAMGIGGTLVAGYYIKEWCEQPRLIDAERRITWLTPFWKSLGMKIDTVSKKPLEKKISIPPVFNEEISRKMKDFSKGIVHIQKNHGYFQNALFYGPGGVGKTMICDKIAEDANVNFIKLSGGNLAESFARGDHVKQLNKLFDYIESSSLPTVLFVDEAESLCGNRNKMDAQHLELINAFLHRTGTPSKKLILLMATNRVQDLDPAILNRMDYKIHVAPPALAERIKMINNYVPKFFTGKDRFLFTPEKVKWIAEQFEELTGRAVFKMMNKLEINKVNAGPAGLTPELIDQTVRDIVQEENELSSLPQ